MTLKWRRRAQRPAVWLFLALLAACGGGAGIVAVVQIVTPLGGSWAVKNTINEDMSFDNTAVESTLFTSQLNLTAEINTDMAICGGPDIDISLEGTLNNGNLVLSRVGNPNTCLQGSFTDLITLEAGPPSLATQSYENDRVDVQMDKGLWVSTGGGQLKLKFNEPFSVDNDDPSRVIGCVVSVNPLDQFDSNDINNPSSEMDGFDTGTRAKPTIPEIKSILTGLTLFTQVVFEDGATLKLLDSNGDSVTLHREEDTTTTCP